MIRNTIVRQQSVIYLKVALLVCCLFLFPNVALTKSRLKTVDNTFLKRFLNDIIVR